MGDARVNAMAFFVWRQARAPHFLTRLTADRRSRDASQSPRSACVSRLTKIEAEDLIDWLEATGRHQWKLIYVPGEGFSVTFN
ncbi:MAG TPA: hypothetical protein VKU02_22390 [Gemmataceae bacterium]|nr:hypothetical protein [Gemmataceae bacterium]